MQGNLEFLLYTLREAFPLYVFFRERMAQENRASPIAHLPYPQQPSLDRASSEAAAI